MIFFYYEKGQFGTRGCGESQLAGPHFCALNSFHHTIISDFHNHAIKVAHSLHR